MFGVGDFGCLLVYCGLVCWFGFWFGLGFVVCGLRLFWVLVAGGFWSCGVLFGWFGVVVWLFAWVLFAGCCGRSFSRFVLMLSFVWYCWICCLLVVLGCYVGWGCWLLDCCICLGIGLFVVCIWCTFVCLVGVLCCDCLLRPVAVAVVFLLIVLLVSCLCLYGDAVLPC